MATISKETYDWCSKTIRQFMAKADKDPMPDESRDQRRTWLRRFIEDHNTHNQTYTSLAQVVVAYEDEQLGRERFWQHQLAFVYRDPAQLITSSMASARAQLERQVAAKINEYYRTVHAEQADPTVIATIAVEEVEDFWRAWGTTGE